ncbi:GntR family transcriptional regulator [Erythrobacter rubeus]|nr:GntR family transcriptional regulator [Erythrobacter rubeus]
MKILRVDNFVCNFVRPFNRQLLWPSHTPLVIDAAMTKQTDLQKNADAASLVDSLVEAIVDGVMDHRYAPGQRLVATDLAEEFGVSRAPVREALHVLAGEGVVELVANRGARIRKLSRKERVDFLEFTEALCMLGVRQGVTRIDEGDNRKRLDEHFSVIEEAWSRRHAADFVDALYRYHIALNRISGNGFVKFFYERPYIRFYTIMLADLAPGENWEQYISNYREIHQTILDGDQAAAMECFSSHISWVLSFMKR